MDARYKPKIDIKLTVNKHTSYDFKPTEGPSLNSYWTICPLMVTGPLGSLVMLVYQVKISPCFRSIMSEAVTLSNLVDYISKIFRGVNIDENLKCVTSIIIGLVEYNRDG